MLVTKLRRNSARYVLAIQVAATMVLVSSCSSGVGATETRTFLYSQDLAAIDSKQIPCFTKLEIDSSSINCLEENLPGWSLFLYRDEKELFEMACVYSVPQGANLIGENWKLNARDDFELDRELLESIQSQLGGEIVQVRDYCLE